MDKDLILSEESVDIESIGSRISNGIGQIIEQSKYTIAVYLNTEVTLTYWRIGRCIAKELDAISDEKYGSKIVSTLSRQLTWSHFVELSVIPEPNKRLFYQQMSILYHWSVRQLRDQEDGMASLHRNTGRMSLWCMPRSGSMGMRLVN
jgi:hypothetical protein